MSFPGVPLIRVGYMAPRLPYPVSVHLPPTSTPDTRSDIRTSGPELDIAVPLDPMRHEKLGEFLDAWSSLEGTLAFYFTELMQIDVGEASLIAPKLGTRSALDLLSALALRKIDDASATQVGRFIERAHRLNGKRNILVHGRWVLEVNVVVRRGEACIAPQFLREVIPDDPAHAKAMGDPRNQKIRVRYSFTIRRIEGATRDTDTLNREMCNLLGKLTPKEMPHDELMQKLLFKRPYRVTTTTEPRKNETQSLYSFSPKSLAASLRARSAES
jgi:hypothetical protein